MGNYTILGGSENPRRGGQARNLTTNVPKILDLKSSSEQMFYENCRWVPLTWKLQLLLVVRCDGEVITFPARFRCHPIKLYIEISKAVFNC